MTLNERVLDLLADIVFATEEIRDMVDLEQGLELFVGFNASLGAIGLESKRVMQQLSGAAPRTLGDHEFGRDHALADVLDDIARRLASISHICTRDYDDALVLVEAFAAPYALAFFHEIQRLDALVANLKAAGNSGAGGT
jgi:hypothetical protein